MNVVFSWVKLSEILRKSHLSSAKWMEAISLRMRGSGLLSRLINEYRRWVIWCVVPWCRGWWFSSCLWSICRFLIYWIGTDEPGLTLKIIDDFFTDQVQFTLVGDVFRKQNLAETYGVALDHFDGFSRKYLC